jgi:5-methylcytosine-specific restriction enzyme subunit McrC
VRHHFDVAYDEFSADTLLNQVFRHVVDRLLLLTQQPRNSRHASRPSRLDVGGKQPGITPSHLDRAAARITRLNEQFLPAFNLARMFLENEALQLSKVAGRV